MCLNGTVAGSGGASTELSPVSTSPMSMAMVLFELRYTSAMLSCEKAKETISTVRLKLGGLKVSALSRLAALWFLYCKNKNCLTVSRTSDFVISIAGTRLVVGPTRSFDIVALI